jgi:hypothetical protein
MYNVTITETFCNGGYYSVVGSGLDRRSVKRAVEKARKSYREASRRDTNNPGVPCLLEEKITHKGRTVLQRFS